MYFTSKINKKKLENIAPGLYVVSTPIGNLEDITLRAIKVLKNSNFILCEDTRRSLKLLNYYQITSKLISYHKYNERKTTDKVVDLIKKNNIVSLISDAGTPTISDPGLILVNHCIQEKINVYPIPGPSAVTSAISVSGFDDQYIFYGFLPKTDGSIDKSLKALCNLDYSIVFFIPAKKINFFLKKFKKFFLNRKIFVAKEMTKIYENSTRDDVKSIKDFSTSLKGELTVILSKKINKKFLRVEISDNIKLEIKKMLKKYSHKDVVEFISKKENLSKKIVYNFCLKHNR